jgi:hypothetical protein
VAGGAGVDHQVQRGSEQRAARAVPIEVDQRTRAVSRSEQRFGAYRWVVETMEMEHVVERQSLVKTVVRLVDDELVIFRRSGSAEFPIEAGQPGHGLIAEHERGAAIVQEALDLIAGGDEALIMQPSGMSKPPN